MKKRIAQLSALAIGLAAVFSAPSAANAANGCVDTPLLSNASGSFTAPNMPAGSTAAYYNFAAGVANGSSFPTRVSYVSGSLDKFKIDSTFTNLGRSASQLSLAYSRPGSIAHMNSDFFDTGTNMPYSAIIRDSQLVYSPPRKSGVLALANSGITEASGFSINAVMGSGGMRFNVLGVNLAKIPANTVVAYTPKASSAVIAKGSYGILVINKKLVSIYAKGVNKRPSNGVIIQASGTAATSLKRLKLGASVSYTVPVPARYKIVADMVTPSGYVQTNTAKLMISAVNYSGAVENGAILYDANYSNLVSQWVGAKTLFLDSTGKVVAFYASGRNKAPSASYPYVLQLSANAAQQIATDLPKAGMQFTIKNTFRSSSGADILSGTGRGNLMMSNALNNETCTAKTEQIRPRSVIGWNSKGQFWLITSTMGVDYADAGYRQGGSTLHQMADWLIQLGATEAVSFDGGGSTTLYANDGTGHKRMDLPATAWLREAPTGIAIVPVG